jgi:hypothetical protein
MDRSTSSDTTPEARAVQDDIYRRLGGRERVAIQFRLSTAARAMTLAGILARHPDYTETQARMALARIIFGDDLVRNAWPDRELVEP